MRFKNQSQRKAVMAKIKNKYFDFSEYTQNPNYVVEWSPYNSSKKHIRFFVNESNAIKQVKDTMQHKGYARIIRL